MTLDLAVAPGGTRVLTTTARPMMGGRVSVTITDDAGSASSERSADAVLDRIAAWASRLTRFDTASELSQLNEDVRDEVPVGPTMTAVLDWARTAEALSDGLVNIAMLDARLAAETGAAVRPAASRRWSLRRHARGASVLRCPGLRFDLDGVAKGWIADRALAITPGASALVDGDGDLAVRLAHGDEYLVGVDDPRSGDQMALLRLTGGRHGRTLGVATSGTTVHRWLHGGGATHHLIDPLTWRPADTDVIQATVIAACARDAEVFAKVAILAGADRAPALLDRPGVHGVLLLTTRGEIRASSGMLEWLA